MPSKNKFPLSGLSKQQKEILKLLYNDKNNVGRKIGLSRKIAEKFEKKSDYSYAYGWGKHEILSNIHRASMSRSIKRLKERGLIESYYDIKFDIKIHDNGKWSRILKKKYTKKEYQKEHRLSDWGINRKKPTWFGLTKKGLKYFKKK